MTAYMVLSLLQLSGKGYLEEAARAVRWINTQRNSHGGFHSTQVNALRWAVIAWLLKHSQYFNVLACEPDVKSLIRFVHASVEFIK